MTVIVRYQLSGRSAAEVAASVEAGVRAGQLAPGAALPPVRRLAADLGLAPATVAAAYQQLRQRGVVETAGRNGTRIRPRPPLASRLARRPLVPSGVLDLSSGEPDPRLLAPLGQRLRHLAGQASTPIGYHQGGAWPDLVQRARHRLAADGVPMRSAALTVTCGALDAIERLLAAHLRPGDRVGVEDPGWANLIDLVAALGLHPVAVPVDAEGPTVEGLRRAIASGIDAVVVTSRAQNPTGAAVSAQRAAALRPVIATAPALLVIEDDHAAELAELPLSTLAAAGPHWAFVRSVSKPYGPDLRLAVVAGDEASIARIDGRMRLGSGWVSTLLQRLVVLLWDDPATAAGIERARAQYAQRRQALIEALEQRGVSAQGSSGINVWVPVADEASVVFDLREAGFAVAPGFLYRLAAGPGIRITVAGLEPSNVERLADAVARSVGDRSATAPVPTGTVR